MKGFVAFIREQGVVGLAVGFILGGAVSKLVASFVSDIVGPFLSVILGVGGGIAGAKFTLASVVVPYGSFLATLIDFLVVAAVVYFGVKLLRLDNLDKKPE